MLIRPFPVNTEVTTIVGAKPSEVARKPSPPKMATMTAITVFIDDSKDALEEKYIIAAAVVGALLH